jgi:transposase
MARKTKYDYYNDAFKATAVELGALPGVHAKDVAEVLDIHPIMLYRWKKEYREGVIMKKSDKSALDTEMARELKRLKKIEKAHETLLMEHEILKKSIQYCSDRKRKSLSTSIRNATGTR